MAQECDDLVDHKLWLLLELQDTNKQVHVNEGKKSEIGISLMRSPSATPSYGKNDWSTHLLVIEDEKLLWGKVA